MENAHALRVFAAVAQELSFTRAGEKLFLTQSAVSHQIAALERELGAQLFERHGRRVELTPPGRVLLEQARRILGALADVDQIVRDSARPDAISLRIGASATACQFIIPEAVREFRACYPASTLSIRPGDSPQVVEQLQEGQIDLGLLIRPEGRAKFVFHPLFEDQLGFVVSRLHPWARARRISTSQIARERLVLYSRQSATYRLVERLFARWKLPLRDALELGSIEAIKELVKLGLGVTLLSRWVCQSELEEGSLCWLTPPGGSVRRQWCIATPANRRPTIAEQTFIGLCQSASEHLAHG